MGKLIGKLASMLVIMHTDDAIMTNSAFGYNLALSG